MSPQTSLFCGGLSIGGADAAKFAISGGNLVTVGVLPAGSYAITIIATPQDGAIAPLTQAFTPRAGPPPPSQALTAINLSPSQFQAGAGSANAVIGTITATMDQGPAFAGTFTQTNPNFVIVGTTLKVGAADLPANTYSIPITATPSDGSILPLTQTKSVTGNGAAGVVVTTYTIQNASFTAATTVGQVHFFGHAFRRGDFPIGSYPVFRDATTHVPLIQQLDDIATFRENSDDGSMRHAAVAVQLPVAIPARGTYTMEIIKQTGTYSAAGKQTLAALCAAHDLKLDMTDVRNQDHTVRDSGHAVSRVCDNVNNTGRDAPRHVRAGPVSDTYIVRGPPIYATSGNKDPLLYVEWTLDLTTDPSNQTSLGQVRHVAFVMNPWMNVAAGTVGDAGAPGPVGFANDPQVVSYHPQLLDSATNLIDWSWYNASLDSSTNPILLNTTAWPGCGSGAIDTNGQWTIPGSVGTNAWYHGMAVEYHTAGTPPAGMTNDRIYFINASGTQYTNVNANNGQKIYLARIPSICTGAIPDVIPTTEGSGTQTFSFRIWQYKWGGWYTWMPDAKENWTVGTTSARTVSNLYPSLSTAEIQYWKESGSVMPFKPNDTGTGPFNYIDYNTPYYTPQGLGPMGGGGGGAERSPLGVESDYFAQALITERVDRWDMARFAAYAWPSWPSSVMREEVTGRIPIFNNGPPAANHGGGGGSYTEGSVTFPTNHAGTVDIFTGTNMDGLVFPREGTPEAAYSGAPGYNTGLFTSGGNDHVPAYSDGWYQFHGGRAALDAVYTIANRQFPSISTGDLMVEHQTSTVNGVRFYGLHNVCCQVRGAYWMHRDTSMAAAYGADSNMERTYFNDVLQENYWDYQAVTTSMGGNFGSLFTTPYFEVNPSTFKNVYGHLTMSLAWARLRDPLSGYFLPRFVQEHLNRCSDTVPNTYSSYYCGGFNWTGNIFNPSTTHSCAVGDSPWCPGSGAFFANDYTANGEAKDYWCVNVGNGADVWTPQGSHDTFASNGDKVRNPSEVANPQGNVWGAPYPDQISDRTFWFTISNVVKNSSNGVDSFKIINPATGTPFTAYTVSGTPQSACLYLSLRPMDPADSLSTGFFSSYSTYAYAAIKMLMTVGQTNVLPAYNKVTARGVTDFSDRAKLAIDENTRIH